MDDLLKRTEGYTFNCVIPGRLWTVTNREGREYQIRPKDGACTCPAFKVCCHLKFVWELEKRIPQLSDTPVIQKEPIYA